MESKVPCQGMSLYSNYVLSQCLQLVVVHPSQIDGKYLGMLLLLLFYSPAGPAILQSPGITSDSLSTAGGRGAHRMGHLK